MAIAIKNPPIRRKIIWFPYSAVTFPTSSAPSSGKRIIGRREVAGIGTTSVSHQHAIHTVLAAMDFASHDSPYKSEKIINKNMRGPSTRPTFCLEVI
jgi:hypothetical protein